MRFGLKTNDIFVNLICFGKFPLLCRLNGNHGWIFLFLLSSLTALENSLPLDFLLPDDTHTTMTSKYSTKQTFKTTITFLSSPWVQRRSPFPKIQSLDTVSQNFATSHFFPASFPPFPMEVSPKTIVFVFVSLGRWMFHMDRMICLRFEWERSRESSLNFFGECFHNFTGFLATVDSEFAQCLSKFNCFKCVLLIGHFICLDLSSSKGPRGQTPTRRGLH